MPTIETIRLAWDHLPPLERRTGLDERAALRELPREVTGSVYAPCRPFAFYITKGAEAVHVDDLWFGSTRVLGGVPGSLLRPRSEDYIDERPGVGIEDRASNIGDQSPILPGQSIRLGLRNVSSAPVDFEALVLAVGYTPIDDEEEDRRYEALRELRERSERAEKFFLALAAGAALDVARRGREGLGYEELKTIAREFAAEWSAENVAIETRAGFPPREKPPARPRYRMDP